MDRQTERRKTDNIGFCELVLITESPFHNTNKQTIHVLIVVHVVVIVNIQNMSVGCCYGFFFCSCCTDIVVVVMYTYIVGWLVGNANH